jgi:hypothetical protein
MRCFLLALVATVTLAAYGQSNEYKGDRSMKGQTVILGTWGDLGVGHRNRQAGIQEWERGCLVGTSQREGTVSSTSERGRTGPAKRQSL